MVNISVIIKWGVLTTPRTAKERPLTRLHTPKQPSKAWKNLFGLPYKRCFLAEDFSMSGNKMKWSTSRLFTVSRGTRCQHEHQSCDWIVGYEWTAVRSKALEGAIRTVGGRGLGFMVNTQQYQGRKCSGGPFWLGIQMFSKSVFYAQNSFKKIHLIPLLLQYLKTFPTAGHWSQF